MKKILLICLLAFISAPLIHAQNTSKKVSLLWDSSYGMVNKDLPREFAFLDSYFNRNPQVEVKLRVFSNTIILEETFMVTNGNWDALKRELGNTIYDGSASFANIFDGSVDEVLLVSDGNETVDELPDYFSKPVYVISSVKQANEDDLNTLAFGTGGAFFNLIPQQAESTGDPDSEYITVSGIVTDQLGPLSEVNVLSRENNKSTVTANDGSYTIEALRGGVLEFSYLGKNTQVSRVTSGVKNIVMTQGNEVLGEVLVTATLEDDEEDYMVNTGNTKQDRRKLGYAVESIGSEDISTLDTDVQQAVSGQFSNLTIANDTDVDVDLSQFLSRGRNMSILLNQYGLIVIDGVPQSQTDSSFINSGEGFGQAGSGTGSAGGFVDRSRHLNPDNIESITFLKGLAATNKYGTLGRNGVLLITTKTAAVQRGATKEKPVLGTTATYTGSVEKMKDLPDTPYINALKQSSDIDQAYATYLDERKRHGTNASFFFNVASYFNDWNNPYMLDRILSNVSELSEVNTSTLTAQAYKYEEFGLYNSAVTVYERILKQEPDEVQNYRNLALAYHNAGNYEKALVLYDRMDRKHFSGIANSDGLRRTINNEFRNLLALHKGKLQAGYVKPLYFKNVVYDTRVVFEWNVYDAEFDLQIVNPQKRFFTWSHTQGAEGPRMAQEMSQGYGLEEFFMTAADKGEWLFNLTYFGTRTGDNNVPTYIKITTYRNFGKPNQTKEVKVIGLHELNKKETVLTVNI